MDDELRQAPAATERPIGERRRAIESRVLASIRDAVIAVDGDGIITYWNAGATRLFGPDETAAVGRLVGEVVAETGLVREPRLVEAIRRRTPFDGDVRAVWPDGRRGILEVITYPLDAPAADDTASRVAILWDVTEERAATEQALRLSARLAAIVRTAPDLIASADRDGVVRTWNAAGHRLLGYAPDEIIGRSIATYVDPESLPVAMELRGRILDGAADEAQGEIVCVAKDGTRIPGLLRLGPINGEDGEVVGVSAVLTDLRPRRVLEEQVRRSQELEAVSRLASGIAVDYNNMLTAISGYGHLLEAELDPATPAGDAVRQILRASHRAADLTRSLLAFARSGSRDVRTVAVDAVVEHLQPLLRRTVPAHVDLRTSLRSDASVAADTTELELVLVNLATNAAEAMPGGGTLEIATSTVQLTAAQAQSHLGLRAGRHVRIVVRDTGRGMSEEVRANAFVPFFTTKTEGEGRGLGLAMAYAHVRRADGAISIESTPGSGTTVEVLLPALAASAAPPPAAEPAPAPQARGTEHVLLVEDDALVRSLATAVLRRAGYAVTAIADPREAEDLDLGPFDVVLSDILMPGVAGPTMATGLRERRPGIPVVFMSGYAGPELLAEVQALTPYPLLAKPFGPGVLLAAIRVALDEAAVARAHERDAASETDAASDRTGRLVPEAPDTLA